MHWWEQHNLQIYSTYLTTRQNRWLSNFLSQSKFIKKINFYGVLSPQYDINFHFECCKYWFRQWCINFCVTKCSFMVHVLLLLECDSLKVVDARLCVKSNNIGHTHGETDQKNIQVCRDFWWEPVIFTFKSIFEIHNRLWKHKTHTFSLIEYKCFLLDR